MKKKSVKVILDTNVWISFLIGKRLSGLQNHIISGQFTIITSQQLLQEIQIVTQREKLRKYFPKESVNNLLEILSLLALKVEPVHKNNICRDAKDNFLLDLADASNANYLVTGDSDLLVLHPFHNTEILSPSDFQNLIDTDYFK